MSSYGLADSCGIPDVEMLGSKENWANLSEKLKALRENLKPIEDEIGLNKEWWFHAEVLFQKLQETYRGEPVSRPSVRPYQGWSLLLRKASPFDAKTAV